MLEFFRKYQRFFFIFVTVVIVVTFSLFGSYKTMGQLETRKEIVVGHALDGSELKYYEIKKLSALLGAEPTPNGVIRKDLIETGIAERLAIAYFDVLKPDWQSRLDRVKRCRFYSHPAVPSLNAQEIWNQVAPGGLDELRKLQALNEVDRDFFASWSRLYLMQERCPPELIKRILLYHQSQYHILNDPRILSEDFSLCSFQSMSEWYGANFYDLMAQFILNAAIVAEKKGFLVTEIEAKADLYQRFAHKGSNFDLFLQSIGIKKNEAITLWQRVLLFSNYFHSIGQAALVDDLSIRQFSDFANTSAVLDVFQLPQELRLHSLDDLLNFEVYSKFACSSQDPLDLPTTFLSVEEVEKKLPEIVATSYQIRCAKIDVRSIESHLSMRKVWDWQIENNHWDALKKNFPALCKVSGKNPFEILEKLDFDQRSAIDDWSRKQIVASHPEWLEQEFAKAEMKDYDVLFYSNDEIDGIAIQNGALFRNLIDSAIVENSQMTKSFQEDETIWRILNVEKKSDKKILSFQEALLKGRINSDRFLEKEYLQIRGEDPSLYQNEKGEWLPFGEVRETVIRQVFAPLFFAIDCEMGTIDLSQPLSFYVSHRFHAVMQKMLESLQSSNEFINSQGIWTIEKSEKTVNRSSNEEWLLNEPFHIKIGQWSDVHVPLNGEIVFFYLKNFTQTSESIQNQLQQGKEILAADAEGCLADQLIEKVLKKQAIVLPIQTQKEKDDNL